MDFNGASEEQRVPRGLKRLREEEELLESFEAYFNYDASTPEKEASKVKGAQISKRPCWDCSPSAALTKHWRVVPLPASHPIDRPQSSNIVPPLLLRSIPAPEDSSSPVKRVNTKSQVYSGPRAPLPPRMTTPQLQCIRLLQNNINAITELEGVPFEILKPALERCSPVELLCIEQKSQRYTKDLEELWMHHCRRHFNQETPRQHESWRGLYLRLQNERQERLKMLTSRISVHANKCKGRQVILAEASPPPDIRRLQEQFGTANGSTAASFAAADPFMMKPVSHSSRSSVLRRQGGAAGGRGSGG